MLRIPYKLLSISLLLQVFVCNLSCLCGEPETESSGAAVTTADLLLAEVTWREIIDGPYDLIMAEEDFRSMAAESLRKLPPVSRSVESIGISGSVDVSDSIGALVLEVRISIKDHLSPFETGIAAVGSAGSKDEALSLVKKGVEDLMHAMKNLLGLVGVSKEDLIKALEAAEADEQIMALKLLGHDKIKSAIPAIGPLLSDPRPQVSEAAAEALVQIGDESAVPILINGIKRYDLRSEVRAIEAMGRIGGAEAKAYLEMIAEGHDIEEVRQLAKSLLEDMNKNK